MPKGRPKKPGVVTTVRYQAKFIDFVQMMNLSDFLNARLEEAVIDAQSGPKARFVREARRYGLSDAQIHLLMNPEPEVPIA